MSQYNTAFGYGQRLSASLRRRPLHVYIAFALVSCFFLIHHFHSSQPSYLSLLGHDKLYLAWNYNHDAKNLLLNTRKCERIFPTLFDEIDRLVRLRKDNHITLRDLDEIELRNGYVRGMLYDSEIYVIATQGEIYSRGLAVLHALHRAVISSPETLPNIEFVLSTDDKLPPLPIWSFARERNDDVTWLMPDFGFWSWPETHVGSYGEIQRKALEMEDTSDNPSEKSWPWARKKDQLFWRGATMGLGLRDKFIESTINKTWADVKAIQWHDSTSMGSDLKSMDEHCQYKYLAHTEGNSYSGRLKYLQNCRSVIVAHTMEWVQHYTPLMIASGARQNFVEVQRDFSDLESTMLSLQKNDRKAAMIAGNSVSIFRERYLTPAAEACYWRRLIRGWAEVTPEPSPWTINNTTSTRNWRGIPVESYLLERRLTWDPY